MSVGLFFCTPMARLSRFQSISVFRACFFALGFPAQELGVHSFCIVLESVVSKLVFLLSLSWLLGSGILYLICFMFGLACCTDGGISYSFFQVHSGKSGWLGTASYMGLADTLHLPDGTPALARVTGCISNGWAGEG